MDPRLAVHDRAAAIAVAASSNTMDTTEDNVITPTTAVTELKQPALQLVLPASFQTVQPSIDVYPLENYSFGSKPAKLDKDDTVVDRLVRLEQAFETQGVRRTVEGVLLVHLHGHPHVLLLHVGHKFFKLPGGKLKPGEATLAGLYRKLTNKLASPVLDLQPQWQQDQASLLSVLYRPTLDGRLYPYKPAHVAVEKERKQVFVAPLPEKCMFSVPDNLEMIAVPFFELHSNPEKYGTILHTLPVLLSAYRINCLT